MGGMVAMNDPDSRARSACLAYIEAAGRLRALSRPDPDWPAASRAALSLMDAAGKALVGRGVVEAGGYRWRADATGTLCRLGAALPVARGRGPASSYRGLGRPPKPDPVPPCVRCKTPGGWMDKRGRRPTRTDCTRFGVAGLACKTCYEAIKYRHRKAGLVAAADYPKI